MPRVRIVSFILLFVFVPAIASGIVGRGGELCIASDHVALGCHEDARDESSGSETRIALSAENCLDVAGATVDMRANDGRAAIHPMLFTFVLNPPLLDCIATGLTRVCLDDDADPHRFCARSYTTSIALRC